ncbi:MAG: acylneuraminate cytidylyltransferase family protein, partial [Candidatus Heimdallarchaeota archaeon]|nr:acylneuraminate cytidylyltransferase family protein [Candidatus Heimdallarchaeota archaeon]
MVNINDKNHRILATICARGGSKGFPKKNIQLLAGKPLIAHTILFLKKWGKFDYMILSTDDVDIAKIGVDYGVSVPFIRPDNLASDNASKFDVIKHALKFMEQKERITFDLVIDLDPTAPLREQYFLDESLDLFLQRK